MREIRRRTPHIKSADAMGALDDVNEQELAKDVDGTYEQKQNQNKDGEEVSVKLKDESVKEDATLPLAVDKKEEQITVSQKQPQNREKEKTEKTRVEANKNKEESESEETPRPRRTGGFYVAFIVLCALLSVAVVLYAVLGVRPAEQVSDDTDVNDAGETTPNTDESITDSRSAYDKMLSSAVTVRCRTENGTRIGSGTVMFEGGYVATLWDTVNGAENIEIILRGGEGRRAVLVGGSSLSELALLKIEGDGLEIPDVSSEIRAGDTVYAVGAVGSDATSALPSSLCKGSIAYRERSIRVEEGKSQKLIKAIQLDGFNSTSLGGCPMFNEDGAAVAIMVNIGNGDASFALPIEDALAVLLPIKDGQTPPDEAVSAFAQICPRLGAECEESTNGVKIAELLADSDAALKLKVGDIIVKIGERAVSDIDGLKEEIETHRVGETVEVFVYRHGQMLSFYVILSQ